jgi:hypothetical protein
MMSKEREFKPPSHEERRVALALCVWDWLTPLEEFEGRFTQPLRGGG